MNKPTPFEQQETPSFDPVGAARDEAYKSLPGLMEIAAKEKPRVGISVRVMQGKHKGKIGLVFWHGPDPHFYSHMSDMSECLRQARGIYGFRVGIKTDSEKIFVDAENVEIQKEGKQ